MTSTQDSLPRTAVPEQAVAAPAVRRVLAQAELESKLILRHGEQLLLSLVLPVLLLIGLGTTGIMAALQVDLNGMQRLDMATPGVLALCIVSTAFTGQAIATGFDRRYGVLRLLATTPLGRSGLLLGKIIAVLLVELVQVVVICGLAAVLGWRPHAEAFVPVVVTIVLGTTAFTGLGLLIAGTLRAEATLAGANLLWVLFLVGGGLVVPANGALAQVADFLPSAALGNAMRAGMLGGNIPWLAWLILAVWALGAGLATMKWFKWS
ncbi:ABC transporter permease [Saxibacter everestensis]|uniref:ABC transporter permease n=1 Tax=Saxibacter everestensis TaxID=2909229 RepID=A0ABY8QZ59_9MICO|nr:ABC transporter permease [Brevibacteriaceae bacterium ZFBP1038]